MDTWPSSPLRSSSCCNGPTAPSQTSLSGSLHSPPWRNRWEQMDVRRHATPRTAEAGPRLTRARPVRRAGTLSELTHTELEFCIAELLAARAKQNWESARAVNVVKNESLFNRKHRRPKEEVGTGAPFRPPKPVIKLSPSSNAPEKPKEKGAARSSFAAPSLDQGIGGWCGGPMASMSSMANVRDSAAMANVRTAGWKDEIYSRRVTVALSLCPTASPRACHWMLTP